MTDSDHHPRVLFVHGLESGPNGKKVQFLREQFRNVECCDMQMSLLNISRHNSVIRNVLRGKYFGTILVSAILVG